MAWIESHQALGNHPKTNKAAELLKIPQATVIGHLQYLWWWALDYAQDGDLTGFTARQIADAMRWKKNPDDLIDALAGCGLPGQPGFIERAGDYLIIHDWDEYAGKLITKRRTDAARKRRDREVDVQRTSTGHPPDICVTAQVPTQPTQPTQPNSTATPAPPGAAPRRSDEDAYRTLCESLGDRWLRESPEVEADYRQIAEDYSLQEINAAIRKCREQNLKPWPRNVRHELGAKITPPTRPLSTRDMPGFMPHDDPSILRLPQRAEP